MAQTFGHLSGDRKPSPQNYMRKHTGTMGNETLPEIRHFSYDSTCRKPSVPKSTDRPIYGMKSGRDFIVKNALENILSTPKRNKDEMNWMHKKDYGKNPEYLDEIKTSIQR